MQVSNNKIIIHGKQGGGKTVFAVLLSSGYIPNYIFTNYSPRVYGNVKISKRDQMITNFISDTKQLLNFSFSRVPGVCILDEVGINFNSKKGTSEKNEILTNWFFLCRKYNVSPIFVSQRIGSVPVDMRELSDYIFEVRSIHRKGKHPLFIITRQSLDNEGNLVFEEEMRFDIISYLQLFDISYDTLESSIIS